MGHGDGTGRDGIDCGVRPVDRRPPISANRLNQSNSVIETRVAQLDGSADSDDSDIHTLYTATIYPPWVLTG